MIKQEKKRTQIKDLTFGFEDFPGGSEGFELVSRFSYNNGRIPITIHNVSHLYRASIFLCMTDKYSNCNLLQQTETFLEGMFNWSWNDVLICLRSCENYYCFADSCTLIDNIKIRRSNSSSKTTPDLNKQLSSSSTNNTNSNTKAWWFDDLSTLSPMIIEKVIRNLGAFGSDNNSLLLTKFLLHYLKTALQGKKKRSNYSKTDYNGLADTAIYGVILMGKTAFSSRALFWVMRLLSGFDGISKSL